MALGHGRIERHEAEVMVDEAASPISGEDFTEVLSKASIPGIIYPLWHVNEAVHELEKLLECPCDDAGCITSAPHAKIAKATLLSQLEGLKIVQDGLREQTIEAVEQFWNCECTACKVRSLHQASRWN